MKTIASVFFLAALSIGSVQAVDILNKDKLGQYDYEHFKNRQSKVKGEMKKIVFEALVSVERDDYFSRTEEEDKKPAIVRVKDKLEAAGLWVKEISCMCGDAHFEKATVDQERNEIRYLGGKRNELSSVALSGYLVCKKEQEHKSYDQRSKFERSSYGIIHSIQAQSIQEKNPDSCVIMENTVPIYSETIRIKM